MSEESYQDNVKRGVTGPETETSFVAAFDRISKRTGVSSRTYQDYRKISEWSDEIYEELDHVPAEYMEATCAFWAQLWRELGVNNTKNNNGMRPETLEELDVMLKKLTNGGFRTIVYLSVEYREVCVGLIARGDGYYKARSTWTPFNDEDCVSVAEIFPLLRRLPRARIGTSGRTLKDVNVFALAPEPRR